jgi:hypothetical protein
MKRILPLALIAATALTPVLAFAQVSGTPSSAAQRGDITETHAAPGSNAAKAEAVQGVAGGIPVSVNPTGNDYRPGAATITAVDVGSTSSTGQGGVTIYAGTPTVGSVAAFALNGQANANIEISGTWSAAPQIEVSQDLGMTWVAKSARLVGSAITGSAITGNGVFRVVTAGFTNIRVHATAFSSGPVIVSLAATATTGDTEVTNPVPLRGADAATADSVTNPTPFQSVYGPSGVTPVDATFVATGQSATFTPVPGRGFNLNLDFNAGTGSVQLERNNNGTWRVLTVAGTQVSVFTSSASEQEYEAEFGVTYRLNATLCASCSIHYRISQ